MNIIIFIFNTLLAPQSELTKHNERGHCSRRLIPAVWERSHLRQQLYRNTLMTDFAQAFKNDHNNILDAMKWDRSAG